MMKRIVLMFALAVLASCGGDVKPGKTDSAKKRDSLVVRPEDRPVYFKAVTDARAGIDSMNRNIFEKNMPPDKRMMQKALTANLTFANYFPKDSMAAQCLYDAAAHARALGDKKQAVMILEKIVDGYKSYKRYRFAVSICAQTYDELSSVDPPNREADIKRAKELYQMLIDKFPGTQAATDAKTLIQHVGDKTFDNTITTTPQK